MFSTPKVILIALIAGALGLMASLALNPPAILMRSELGQRLLQIAAGVTASGAALTAPQLGDRLSTFRLPDLNGKTVSLPDDFRGRSLLINVWASWCSPCLEEMPELDRYARSSHGVQVVGIALDDRSRVEAFLRKVRVRYPILIDSAAARQTSIGLGNLRGALPYSILISADGMVLKQRLGPFKQGEVSDWAMSADQE